MASGLGRLLLNGLSGSGSVRDYAHAAKTFRPNLFSNSPRTKYLFHVYFNINPSIDINLPTELYSYLVKSVELPKYQIDLKEQNQYNRKRLVQTKIKYQPVTITFHDDNAGNIRNLWRAYYNFYYGDGRYAENDYSITKPYNNTMRGKWGFDPSNASNFITSIEIHSFHGGYDQKITLMNPMISSFTHDTHDYAEGNAVMQQTMQITYTAVKYNQGYWSGAPGFADPAFYDTRPSDLTKGYEGNVLDNQGNPFTPGSDYTDPFQQSRSTDDIVSQQNFAYDNRNKFNPATSNDAVNDATLNTINRNNNQYSFPAMNIADLGLETNPNRATGLGSMISEGQTLDNRLRYFGNFPENSWQRSLEDQGYDPRQIVDAEDVVNNAVTLGYVNNNAEAQQLAREYFNDRNGSGYLLDTINNESQVFNAPDVSEPVYKAVNWEQALLEKGYGDADINYARNTLELMNLNLENDQKLTALAEDIVKRKSYYGVMY